MTQAAHIVTKKYNYDEVNINCGCPSNKAQSGSFGAVLMKEPETVARIVEAIRSKINTQVSVKCRLGVDDNDSWEDLC